MLQAHESGAVRRPGRLPLTLNRRLAWRAALLALLAGLILSSLGPVFAQADPAPAQVAEAIRQALFDAQVALMGGDAESAGQQVAAARASYTEALAPILAATAPQADARLRDLFDAMQADVQTKSAAAFAADRSQLWTGLLGAAREVVTAALAGGDGATAARWLLLRDFRASTRFSRPGADATLAVSAFTRGELPAPDATGAVLADLLDTYQAQLTTSLADAAEAQARGFSLRQAEEAGLAAGYFAILAPAYGQQRGESALANAQAAFEALVAAAVAGDDPGFAAAQAAVDTALAGFRAAPLSDEQLARRAGQLVRFAALIPVEYGRGVRNGVVTSDIEVQEALTFHAGSAAAYADLQAYLLDRDPEAAARLDELLAQTLTQIRAVAEPSAVQTSIDEFNTVLAGVLPADWISGNSASDIDVILSILDQVGSAAAQGDYAKAESARLEAYAMLELGIEQRLRGFAPEMANRIEGLFWQGADAQPGLAVLLAEAAPLPEVRATLAALESAFDEASLLIGAGRAAPEAVAANAAVIVFREGLEAVLILASLLASLRTAAQRRYRRPLLIGGALAFLATVVTWVLATSLLSVLLPLGEVLEAIVSLIAIGVLLLITNWFFHKAYWVGWMANFHARKQQLVKGVVALTVSQTVGLVLLGFTSIYREGFETVLFLQSLVLEAGTQVVLQGVALGLLGTAAVGLVTFALQVRLPYKKMLIVTGVMISAVLVTMVGHTVHVMQSLGWLPITPISGVALPFWAGQWLGLFATWQGILLQIGAGVFVIGSYFVAEHRHKRQRETRVAGAVESPQGAR